MIVTGFESESEYVLRVQSGEQTLEYKWGKDIPEGQTVEEYLQSCKREALLLAELELQSKVPPTEITL